MDFHRCRHHAIPIVLGAAPTSYRNVAPNVPFIHVDWFNGPKELADFLHLLDKNDKLYNKFFEQIGNPQVLEWNESRRHLFCIFCFLAHYAHLENFHFYIPDVENWWASKFPNTCIGNGRWVSPLNSSIPLFT